MTQMEVYVDPKIRLIISSHHDLKPRGVVRRQSVVTPSYTTTDNFVTNGGDTIHSPSRNIHTPTKSKAMLLSQLTEAPLSPLTTL